MSNRRGALLTGAAMIAAMVLLTGIDSRAIASAPQLETVRVAVPPMLLFSVPDIGATTTATAAPATVSFDLALLAPGRALRISVKADGDLASAGGSPVGASNIAWTTSNVMNGVGVNGVLSTATYAQVFESYLGALSGRVDLTWTVSLPEATVRAETLQTTLRWKLETITP